MRTCIFISRRKFEHDWAAENGKYRVKKNMKQKDKTEEQNEFSHNGWTRENMEYKWGQMNEKLKMNGNENCSWIITNKQIHQTKKDKIADVYIFHK